MILPLRLNKDFYQNLKAQAWWSLRRRFELTWRARNDPSYEPEDVSELISLPSNLPMLSKLMKELTQPTVGPPPRSGRVPCTISISSCWIFL
jgi:hypothetical protein